jgi:iron complex outermembrane receptor protein
LGVLIAPETQAQDAEAESVLEEVIITGSRIRQDPLEQRLPVLTLSEEDYRATGATSLAEFVQKLPISGSAINQSNNSSGNLGYPSDGGGIGAGAAQIDLRYLTSKRVLVLVDGRRWIKGSSGSGVSGAVDLNSIPVNAVKSIEILQDGASAVYGSDAIGGVLNIITQDDYDGMKASAYYGQYDESDGETLEVDVRFGARGERTRGLLDFSFTDQKAVNTADREESVYPLPGFPFGISSGTPAGRYRFIDPSSGDYVSVAPNAGVDDPIWDPSDPENDDFHPFTLEDRFNYQPFNHLITPNRRLNIFGKAEYDLSDKTMLRILASYNKRESQGRAAPVPLFFGPGGGSTFYMVNMVWPADHPYNPFGIDLGPDNLDFIGRRPIEAGPRIFDQDVDTWYVSAGLDGQFTLGGRDMFWDVTAIWADNSATQTKFNQFNARRLYTAMGPTDVCAANVGCVPLNIVGEGTMTQEMLDYLTYTGIDTSGQELFDFTANLSGSIMELPAGELGFAIGLEHREEDGSFVPDPVVAAGETADVPTNPTNGGFDVDELYGEIIVPIVADRKGFDVLNVSAALRYSDYDLFDSETVSKLAVNWGPTENLMLRASFSEGFRAPNIGELFNLGSRFDASISDRCSNVTPEYAANCAALGVPPDYSQLNPQISVDTGGNRDLKPETSDTYTFGFTWDTPTDNVNSVDSFLVEFNYYDVDIDGAIQPPVAQDLLNACIETLDDIYCSAVNRLPSGTITSIEGTLQNIGGIETSGVDLNLDLGLAETGIGRFRLQLMTSFLLDYDELIPNAEGTFDRIAREGTEVGSPVRGYPETRSTLNTDWMLGDWFARLSLRYMSSITEGCTGLVADFEQTDFCSDGPDFNELSSRLYTDAQVSWSPSRFNDGNWTFTLGVNNLFDERPPICYSCDLNSLDGTLYPIGGQFWYLRAIFEM